MSDTILINEGSAAATPSGPGLACDYGSLVNDVGFHVFGLRPTSSDVITDGVATASQAADILRCIAKGLQYVYSAYRWSFLRPLVSITTVAGTDSYALPSGVDTLEGRLTYPQGTSEPREHLDKTSEVEIRRRLARNATQGRPKLYAETTNAFDPTQGSSRCVTLFPIPDGVYVLSAIGTIRPAMIDATNRYPLGIEVLAPCLTESCLAAAERDLDDTAEGVHATNLRPLLEMAIERDKDYASPDTLGVDHGQESEGVALRGRSGGIYWDAGGGFAGQL